jgi:UPF0042 nucleotide-binding protein
MNTPAAAHSVLIVSYGEGHQDPPRGDALTVDLVDALRNPPDDPAVRAQMTQLTGLDAAVREYVMATPGAREKAAETVARVRALATCGPVTVHVKCWGGRHRSVAIADQVASLLRADGIDVRVTHRHVARAVLPSRRA